MGDKRKAKIENYLQQAEEKLSLLPQLEEKKKKPELKKINGLISSLDGDIQRFQMTEFEHYPEKCQAFERRFDELTAKFKKQASDAGGLEDLEGDDDQESQSKPSEEAAGEAIKFQRGKYRTLLYMKAVNRLKNELDLIDDEVFLQDERFLTERDTIQSSQSILTQTRNLVSFFAKIVFDDLFAKIIVGLIILTVLAILTMAIMIKVKRNELDGKAEEIDKPAESSQNYDAIDEVMFDKLAKTNFGGHVESATKVLEDDLKSAPPEGADGNL